MRYVNKLVDLHKVSGNLTEAGFALHEHAKILKWDNVKLPTSLMSPGNHKGIVMHGKLKEILYEEIISYMEKGNVRHPWVLVGCVL